MNSENREQQSGEEKEKEVRTVLDQLQEYVKPLPPTNLVRESEIFKSSDTRREGLWGMIWMGLIAIFLFTAIAAAYYWKTAKPTTSPEKTVLNTPTQDLREVVDLFLEQASKEGALKQVAHQAFFAYLQSISVEDLPDPESWKIYLDQKEIPGSYRFFLENSITNFIKGNKLPELNNNPLFGNDILFSYPSPELKGAGLKLYRHELSEPDQSHAFTTEAPTESGILPGLTVMDGVVINPVLISFSGLVSINVKGEIFIDHIEQINNQYALLNIRSSLPDYQAFLRMAQQHALDAFQAPLLVFEGVNYAQGMAISPEYVLFQTADGMSHLCKLQTEKRNVYQSAQYLINTYRAIRAVGLFHSSPAGGEGSNQSHVLVFE